MKINNQFLLVGSGPMAADYAKVLKKLGKEFVVVGRGKESAKNFEKNVGTPVVSGGIEKFLSDQKLVPNAAIVAVSEEHLGNVTLTLLKKGVKKILVEKPAGLDFKEIKKVMNVAIKQNAKVYVGYNRRFYSSVEKALKIIKKDGGVLSLFFDFTEASYKIAPLKKEAGVKENWFLQNSTHVIDLAFFLIGAPKTLTSKTANSVSWHKKGAVFVGSGETKNGILFSYHANWISPGRWGLEIMTKKHKLFLRPLEKLQMQELGSFEIRDIQLADHFDEEYKPGIYKQVQSFLNDANNICDIEEQVKNLKYYKKILSN